MKSFIGLVVIMLIISNIMSFHSYGNSKEDNDIYPDLGKSMILIKGKLGSWDENNVHTLSVVEANRNGYKYWGYYGLYYYESPIDKKKAGLVRSNDLIHWVKYPGNPIIDSNCRWPSVILVNNLFYMFYAEYNSNMDSRIVRVTSKDGIKFSGKKIIVSFENGFQNQNPFIFYDTNSQRYYLFYYHGKERGPAELEWDIYVKQSKDINNLNDAIPLKILSSSFIMASPSIVYFNHHYFLTVESFNTNKWGNKWVTRLFESNIIDGEYREAENSPILLNDDACAFQYVFGGKLFIFYSHRYDKKNDYWDLRMVRGK